MNMTLFRKPADREDGRLIAQNNHLVGVRRLVYESDMGGSEETK